GDGCWEVLSREPMLRSRAFRRLPFRPLVKQEVPALMRGYHPIYAQADDELLRDIDDIYAHGSMRDWAVFTHTAAQLCAETHLPAATPEVVSNASLLLGGGMA